MVALQSPCFAKHLLPFIRWIYGHSQALQLNPAAFFGVTGGLVIRFLAGFQDAQILVRAVKQIFFVTRQIKIADALHNKLFFVFGKVI